MNRALVLAFLIALSGCASQPTATRAPVQTEAVPKRDVEEQRKKYTISIKGIEPRVGIACAHPKQNVDKFSQEDWINRMTSCIAKKDWATTEALAESMAKSDIESPWPGYFRSLVASEKGELRRAYWMIELAQKKVGDTDLILYQKARVLLKMRQTQEAMDQLEKALKINASLGGARLFLAQIYRDNRETDNALKHYQYLLEQDSRNVEALRFVADYQFGKNQMSDSVQLYRRLITIGTDDAQIYLRVAKYHEDEFQKNAENRNSLLAAIDIYKQAQSGLRKGILKISPPQDLSGKIKDLESKLTTSPTKKQALNERSKKGVQK